MTFYVQYAEDGTITGTLLTSGAKPDHPRQLQFDEFVNTDGLRVDIENDNLVTCPVIAKERHNASIMMQLMAIDEKSVRAMRDFYLTGDKTALQNLEDQAAELRPQLQ